MGLFNAIGSINRANDLLKRLENVMDLLEYNLNSGNYSSASTYRNEVASIMRQFLETVGQSKTAEISVYTFKGRKFRVMQLAMLLNGALCEVSAILSTKGY